MGFFLKAKANADVTKAASVAARRAAALNTPEAISYAETAIYSIGQNLLDYRQGESLEWQDACLLEAEAQMEVLKAVMAELRRRHDDG